MQMLLFFIVLQSIDRFTRYRSVVLSSLDVTEFILFNSFHTVFKFKNVTKC